jgi:hypothetical protein
VGDAHRRSLDPGDAVLRQSQLLQHPGKLIAHAAGGDGGLHVLPGCALGPEREAPDPAHRRAANKWAASDAALG